ncbi:hypothetical protein AC249_AIPGENE22872 [Exaiptasia diaphana]|nr:hypothetical protein AC249_AIPGENE22872 [Exaiptasia diaphana]
MSSDDDDASDPNQWISRPPSYRSEKMKMFLNKLDKIHKKRSSKQPKFAKKVKRLVGEEKDVGPPTGTPVWAISQDWLKEKQAQQQAAEEANNDQDETESAESEDNTDFSEEGETESEDETEMEFV